jgi:glycosyltransferase involved in cell wall biosynthesis
MKILFIHQNFPGQFKHLAPALAAQGHEVVALGVNAPSVPTPGVKVYLHKPEPPAAGMAPPFQELQAKLVRGVSVLHAARRLKSEGFVPDLVFAHSGWGETFFVKDLFPTARLLVYAEYYFNAEGGDIGFDPEFSRPDANGESLVQLKNLNLMQALVQADRGVSPTTFQRDRHPPLLRDRIEVVHDGIDTSRFTPSSQTTVTLQKAGLRFAPGDEVVTFTVRQLEPYRGYHRFMRALPELLERRPRAHVVIAGGNGTSYGAKPPPGTSWKEVFLKEVAPRLDMNRVHFVGRLPHALLTQLMQVSAVHVYLTYPFVLSWSLLEAMSCGCLVVASRTAPVEEVIEHGRNGLLVDFFDVSGIAATVADALQRRGELQPLREAARQEIVTRFDLKSICLPKQIELVHRIAGS